MCVIVSCYIVYASYRILRQIKIDFLSLGHWGWVLYDDVIK